MSKKKDAIALVLFALAMFISFSEFLRRDDLVSKLIALLLFIATLYLVVISIRDLFNKRVRLLNNLHQLRRILDEAD